MEPNTQSPCEFLRSVPRLRSQVSTDDSDWVYHLSDIQALSDVQVIDVGNDCYLAVREGLSVDFALFREESVDENHVVTVQLVFCGYGTGGDLREMRHTFWGHDREGYVFYMPIQGVINALEQLKKYFSD